ncbi:MAG: hypothetical protein ACR2L4_09505 [Actinomycetota bacterium]
MLRSAMAQERTMDDGSTHVADARGRTTKPGIAFVLVALLTAVLYSFFFGVAIVGDAGFTSDEAVHVAGALGFTAALLLGLVIQVVRPTAAAGFWITTAGIVGMLVYVSIVGDPDNYGGQAGPFDYAYLIFAVPILVLLAFHPARRELLRGARPNAIVIVTLAIAAIPLVAYGVDQALVQRNSWPPKSDPHHTRTGTRWLGPRRDPGSRLGDCATDTGLEDRGIGCERDGDPARARVDRVARRCLVPRTSLGPWGGDGRGDLPCCRSASGGSADAAASDRDARLDDSGVLM